MFSIEGIPLKRGSDLERFLLYLHYWYFFCISALDGLLSGAYNEHFMKFSNPNLLDNPTNQDTDIINVDISTNHSELSSSHVDNVSENGSVVNCYPDRQKSVCMKTKLSPATETHPQNNHAFNTGEEPLMITTCCYSGARPKVPLHTSYSTSQTVGDDNGMVGVTLSSNVVNGSKLYSCVETCAKPVSSQSTTSSKSQTSGSSDMDQKNSAIVGDYFFTNGGFNHVDTTEQDSRSSAEDVQCKPVQSFVDRFVRPDHQDNIPRWADPACQGIKYADEDEPCNREVGFEGNVVFDSSQVLTPTSDKQKRLYLEAGSETDTKSNTASPDHTNTTKVADSKTSVSRKMSRDLKTERKRSSEGSCNNAYSRDLRDPLDGDSSITDKNRKNSTLLTEFERLDVMQTSSLPNSPLHRLHQPGSPTKKLRDEVMNGKCRHSSPLFKRKSKYASHMDTSEDEDMSSVEEIKLPSNYKNLECFQKAQLKQKVGIVFYERNVGTQTRKTPFKI